MDNLYTFENLNVIILAKNYLMPNFFLVFSVIGTFISHSSLGITTSADLEGKKALHHEYGIEKITIVSTMLTNNIMISASRRDLRPK